MDRHIPVIDLASDGAATAIDVAARRYGFFQIIRHGIDEDLVHQVWAETRRFFALPRDSKRTVARTRENPRGYYDRELTKNARDLKEVFDFAGAGHAVVDGMNQWPSDLPTFRDTMIRYFDACTALGHRLLGDLCTGIGVDTNTLRSAFDPDHTSFIRLNYYPLDDPLGADEIPSVTPLGDMALHHHTDAGALTILLQDDAGGLQVEVDSGWIDVTPTPRALVVNVGDMMQVWSNDRYRAALHRVRPMTGRSRFSVPFFFNPAYETNYAPIGPATPRYRSINWGRFRQARTDGDFADYGHEIQIADFRIDCGE